MQPLLTPKDIAQIFGISIWTVYAFTSGSSHVKVTLPAFRKIGNLVRWTEEDVKEFLDKQERVYGKDRQISALRKSGQGYLENHGRTA